MAVDGIVDFVVDNFAISAERMEVLEYIPIYGPSHGRIYVRNPQESIDLEVYTKSLRRSAWIGIPLFCLFIPILAVIVNYNSELCYVIVTIGVSKLNYSKMLIYD